MTTSKLRRTAFAAGIGGLALACSGASALASGFGLREGSSDWMANAFAGDAAKAYDASTSWTNPAGMVRLNRSEFDASINGIFPTINFQGVNQTGATTTTSGTVGANLIQSAATGGTFGVWSYSPDVKFGLAVTAPFGQRVTNPSNFVGRYQSLVSSISDIAVAPSVAFKLGESLSIGGGPVLDYFTARLTSAINTGPLAALAGDPHADLHGHDVSAGFNIGALYQFSPDFRVGIDYRSRIQHGITGTQYISVPPLTGVLSPSTAAQLNFLSGGARTKITLPDSATIGFYYQVNPAWAILSDIQWTDWSVFKSLNVTPTKAGVPGTVIQENWHNTAFVSFGTNYRVTPDLMLQTGVAYDQSPVDMAYRTSRIPDSSRYILSFGAQYDILPNLTVQGAYAHVFFASQQVMTAASPTSGVLIGKYSNSAETASLGLKYKF